MTEQGASDDAKVLKDGGKVIVVWTPSGIQGRYAFNKPSQFKGAFKRLAKRFAEKHFVPEDACKWYCASWGDDAPFKEELDVSLSLSKYIKLHGETRKVVRGCEIGLSLIHI